MKRVLHVVLILMASTSMAQNMSWEWAQGIENADSYESYPLATDSHGNTFTGGIFSKYIKVNKDTINAKSKTDFYVAKYDNKGILQWIKNFGEKGNNVLFDILVDKNDNLIVTGFFTDTINFGGLGLKSKPVRSSFYLKLSNDGLPIWAKQVYYTNPIYYDAIPKLLTSVLDDSGNIFSCGYIIDSMYFGDTLITLNAENREFDHHSVFVAKLDENAKLEWISDIGFIASWREVGIISKIAVGPNGASCITGIFTDTLTFGNVSLVCDHRDDAFILYFDSVGKPIWGKSFGSIMGEDCGENVAIDNRGNVIATGVFCDSMNVDGIPLVVRHVYVSGGPTPSAAEENSYIIKYNAIGELQWAKSIYGHQNRTPGLTLDSLDGIYISGQLSDTNIFSDTTISFEENSRHYYISKLDVNGDMEWLANSEKVYTYNGNEEVILMNGSIYTVGSFEFRLPYLNSPGVWDSHSNIFVAKLSETSTSVDKESTGRSLSLYPNPSSENASLHYMLPSPTPVTITLHDILGREVLRREMGVQTEGKHQETLDVSELPIGSYIVKISTNEEILTSRISVVR